MYVNMCVNMYAIYLYAYVYAIYIYIVFEEYVYRL